MNVYTQEDMKSYVGGSAQKVLDEFGTPSWESPLNADSSLKIMYTHIQVKQEYMTRDRIIFFHLSPPREGIRTVERVETGRVPS